MTSWTNSISTTSQGERNKVLRNTYLLLALSLVPTVLGSWVGVVTGITSGLTGIMGFIIFMAVAFGFIYAIEKNKNSAAGVPILLGFTFFMGLMISNLVGSVLGNYRNGSELVMSAFGSTALVFLGMSTLSTVIKKDLSAMGPWLFAGIIALIGAGLINIFLQSTMMVLVISTISTLVFSLYLLYDLKRIVDGGETNYISATLSVYLSLINIFQSLLSLFGILGGERD